MPYRTHYNRRIAAIFATIYALILAAALALAPHVAKAQVVGQPVAGSDDGRHVRTFLTDSSGRLLVVGSASGSTVYGPDAPNGAGTQSPVRIGGSSSATLNTGTVYNWVMSSAGAGSVNGSLSNGTTQNAGIQVGGWDGTSYRHLGVGISGTATVAGMNTQLMGGSDGTNLRYFKTDSAGSLQVTNGQNNGLIVQGTVGSGSTDNGNPVKVGGVFNTTLPTVTTGQRVDAQFSARGIPYSTITDNVGNPAVFQNTLSNGRSLTIGHVDTTSVPFLYNGAASDMLAGVAAASSNGTGVASVQGVPTSVQSVSLTPVVSSALESGHVLKASAGNLYRLRATVGVSGYVLIFNATTVPSDGAVTPQSCTQVNAGTVELDHQIPDRYSTGISVAFSTTGCFTKTASVNAMFEGFVQ